MSSCTFEATSQNSSPKTNTQHHHCMQHTHLFATTPPPSESCPACIVGVRYVLPFWSSCLPLATDDGLEYNIKTCIPDRLANDVGQSHYTSLNRGEKGKPWFTVPHTSMTLVIPPPHVLGPKYEWQWRPRNSEEFRIGKSQGNLSNDVRRGQQSPPWIRFLGPVGDCGSAKYILQRYKVASLTLLTYITIAVISAPSGRWGITHYWGYAHSCLLQTIACAGRLAAHRSSLMLPNATQRSYTLLRLRSFVSLTYHSVCRAPRRS